MECVEYLHDNIHNRIIQIAEIDLSRRHRVEMFELHKTEVPEMGEYNSSEQYIFSHSDSAVLAG